MGRGSLQSADRRRPSRIDSTYRITQAGSPASKAEMESSMLQALLEDRFQLKMHLSQRSSALMRSLWPRAASNCSSRRQKLHRLFGMANRLPLGCSKLQQAEEGSCTAIDLAQFSGAAVEPGQNAVWRRQGFGGFAPAYYRPLGQHGTDFPNSWRIWSPRHRQDWDQEKFDFIWNYADGANASDAAEPSIVSALGQPELKLEPLRVLAGSSSSIR